MTIRNYTNFAASTTLSSSIGSGDSSLSVGDATNYPTSNFTISINSEIILVGARSGTSFTSLTRGFDGSTAAAHTIGDTVKAVVIAEDFTWDRKRNLEYGKITTDTPDDNFDAGSLDGKWTAVSGSSSTVSLLSAATEEIYDLTTRNDLLTQISTNNSVELRQDYTLPDGNSIILAFTPTQDQTDDNDNDIRIGLTLNDSDTTAMFSGNHNMLYIDGQANNWRLIHWDGNTQGESFTVEVGKRLYLRFARSGLTYYAFYSLDGEVWVPVGNSTRSGAHDNIWLFHESGLTISTPNPICAFHWIRQGSNNLDPW